MGGRSDVSNSTCLGVSVAFEVISSVRTLSSMDTTEFSYPITRSRSCSCTALASLGSVNNSLQEVIANLVRCVQSRRKQGREAQKGFAT